jgi:signal transduction histidine kinase
MAKYEVQLSKEIDIETVAEAIIRMAGNYRDPFISIVGYSEALLEGLSGSLTPTQQTDIEAIRTSGWQALGQLNDIVDVMNLIAEEVPFEFAEINAQSLLKDVIRDVERTQTKEQAPLKTHLAEKLPKIEGDELRLRQMLLGLIGAGITNSPDQISVHLTASTDENGDLQISILDGCQVANEDDLSYFFDPAWLSRLVNNRWRRMQWQSYLAHQIVLAHKGRIWVENVDATDKQNAGTQVTIILPALKSRE